MILTLLPSMTFLASRIVFTSIQIIYYKLIAFPVRTRYWIIREDMRLPPIVLPVVSIHTRSFIMLSQVERTSLGLEVKNIEVYVPHEVMN